MDEKLVTWIQMAVWFTPSVAALLVWLWYTRGGKRALLEAPPRWHHLEVTDVLLLTLLYFGIEFARVAILGTEQATDLSRWQTLSLLFVGQIVLATAVILVARSRFLANLRGFGVRLVPWWRNVGRTLLAFVVGTGLVLLILQITVSLTPDEVQRHPLLERLGERPPALISALILLTAVIGAPLAEETLFRGVLQTWLTGKFGGRAKPPEAPAGEEPGAGSLEEVTEGEDAAGRSEAWQGSRWLGDPPARARWLGIALAAAVWALFHGAWQHMPALFVLGLLLGYLYERYGNLLIPIAVHGLFNLLQVLATLLTPPAPPQ